MSTYKRTEIRKLIDVPAFLIEIERMTKQYHCSYLEAFEEYARRNDLSLEFVANIVKTHKGKMKNNLVEQCRALNLVAE